MHVTLDAHEKDDHNVHVVAHLDTGQTLVAEARTSDLRAAIDDVSDNLVRQVRKEKERLIDRNRKARAGKGELPGHGAGRRRRSPATRTSFATTSTAEPGDPHGGEAGAK